MAPTTRPWSISPCKSMSIACSHSLPSASSTPNPKPDRPPSRKRASWSWAAPTSTSPFRPRTCHKAVKPYKAIPYTPRLAAREPIKPWPLNAPGLRSHSWAKWVRTTTDKIYPGFSARNTLTFPVPGKRLSSLPDWPLSPSTATAKI